MPTSRAFDKAVNVDHLRQDVLASTPLPHHTVFEAQFSLPYCVGVALATGSARLEAFTSDRLHDPVVRALMARTENRPLPSGRLALAEGKPGYQRHRARLKALIRRTLADPVLSPLRLWYEPYL